MQHHHACACPPGPHSPPTPPHPTHIHPHPSQFNFGAVNPCKGNSQYAMLYASPETETQREIFKCAGSARVLQPRVGFSWHAG